MGAYRHKLYSPAVGRGYEQTHLEHASMERKKVDCSIGKQEWQKSVREQSKSLHNIWHVRPDLLCFYFRAIFSGSGRDLWGFSLARKVMGLTAGPERGPFLTFGGSRL